MSEKSDWLGLSEEELKLIDVQLEEFLS